MLVDPDTKSLILKVDDPFELRALIPKSKTLDHPKYNFALKHDMDATRLLRNMGYDVPTPIFTDYDWPGKYSPFDHQREMADFQISNWRGFNLSEMGTGKTYAALWGADYMMRICMVGKCLVISPLSTLETVWTRDIFDILMHRVATVVHGSREKRRKMLAVDADFYILNHDGVKIKEIAEAIRMRKDINYVIVDEGSMFRYHDTDKFKLLRKMIRPEVGIWWMTGTPTPKEPTDAWAQVRVVNPANVPQFHGQFKRDTMIQVSTYKWVPKKNAHKTVFQAMQPAIRFRKADCLDLPPLTFEDRQAQLSKEQQRHIKELRDEMATVVNNKLLTAVNAADKMNKLRQILCGAVKKSADKEEYITIPHAPRLNTLIEGIEGASAKVIVVVPFKGIIRSLATELQERDYSVGVLNGDVPIGKRNAIIRSFKEEVDPHIALCHPKVMSHGINMVEADTIIFYAPIYSNDEYQQVIQRFNRYGQKRKMTVLRIAAHPIEWEVYRAVDTQNFMQENLLDLYRNFVLDHH